MIAFFYHVGCEFRAGLRDRSLLLMNYLFPLLFFALMGALMTKVNPLFKNTMIPAMSLFALMCSTLLSMPGTLVTARDSGLLRSYRINGVPAWAALAAPPAANLLHMAIATAIIAAAGNLAFGAPLPSDWPGFILAWLVSYAALSGLGALIGTVASSSRAAILVSQLVYIPSIMLGGLMMPANVLPDGLSTLAKLFPASHVMRSFAGGKPGTVSLLLLAAGAFLAFGMAMFLYEWDQKNSRSPALKVLAFAAFVPYIASMFLA